MFTEYDIYIGILFYVSSVVGLWYWIRYYQKSNLPFVLPNDGEEMREYRLSLIQKRYSFSNKMWFQQCFSITLGTLFVFDIMTASFAALLVLGSAASSYTNNIKPTSHSTDYLLKRLVTIQAADYAVKDEITRFIRHNCENDDERIRALDYLIERNDSFSESASLIKENLHKK